MHGIGNLIQRALITATAALAIGNPLAAQTRFSFGGYVKLDVLNTKYYDGNVGRNSPLRDIHFPADIPIGRENAVPFLNLDYHAKESRFSLETRTRFANDQVLRAFVEVDFLLSAQGDERVSNSFSPRLRQFFFTYDKFLFGQTWTTFQILEPIVEDLDFGGTADGFIFNRQPQIRLTTGNWQFALENPEVTLEPFGGGRRIITESAAFPDFVARRNFAGKWGTFAVAGMLRQLKHDFQVADTVKANSTLGYALTLGGRVKVGRRDDFRFEASGGAGLGRYAAFNLSNAAVVDSEEEVDAISSVLGFVGYRHFWTERLRTNLNVSGILVDNDPALTGDSVNKHAYSISANLIYSPLPVLDFGVELMRGVREIEDGTSGTFDRLQFSGKYIFGFSTCTKEEGCP